VKKSAITIATLAALSASSFAQSSVTLYGKIDVGGVLDNGGKAGKSVRVSSGVSSPSRLGFKGSEDLGGGYQVAFQIETGFCADSTAGAPNFCTGSNFMGRQAHLDLTGPFGAVSGGRQYSLAYNAFVVIDPFGAGYAGNAANLIDNSGSRVSNSVHYTTPSIAGFFGAGEIAFGEQTGNWEAGRTAGASLGYAAGPAYGGLAYYDVNNANGVGRAKRNVLVGGTYDFAVVKLHAMYQRTDGEPTGAAVIKNDNWLGGATVPLAGGSVLLSYIYKDDLTPANKDASQFGAGYVYPLSRRTSIYTSYGTITNHNGAKYTVGNATEAGTGPRSFNLGAVSNF
jgi:predicted porin